MSELERVDAYRRTHRRAIAMGAIWGAAATVALIAPREIGLEGIAANVFVVLMGLVAGFFLSAALEDFVPGRPRRDRQQGP